MEYRGIEYTVVRGMEPGTWKWTVNAVQVRSDEARLRASAIASATKTIDNGKAGRG
jgi:hypothetical protein